MPKYVPTLENTERALRQARNAILDFDEDSEEFKGLSKEIELLKKQKKALTKERDSRGDMLLGCHD